MPTTAQNEEHFIGDDTHLNMIKVTSYEIHDNGGRPFCVEQTGRHLDIFLQEYVSDEDYYMLGPMVYSADAEEVWIGDNDMPVDQRQVPSYSPKGRFPGNSILFRVSATKYVYVGSEIYSFETDPGDVIESYFSPVGNSDVPYPYAIGQQQVYFMLEKKKIPLEDLNKDHDMYMQLYQDASLRVQPMNEVTILHPRR